VLLPLPLLLLLLPLRPHTIRATNIYTCVG
jgi:hypothetical protein